MSLRSTRLAISVEVARRAYPSGDPGTAQLRLVTFAQTYRSLEHLEDLPAEWAEESIDIAWDLIRDARSRGTLPENIRADLDAAHTVVVEVVDREPEPLRKKPRRDA